MTTSPIHNNLNNTGPDSASRTWKVAREFEALFTSLLMKSMRKTIPEDGLLQKSIGEKVYTDLLDVEYAKIISNNASFGLAEQIVKQIESMGDENSTMKALQEIGNRPWMLDPHFVPNQESFPRFQSFSQRVANFNSFIDEASSKYDVDKNLITAVIVQESGGNPYAVSRAGAKGLMQLMDSTARKLGVKRVFDPHENILAGTKYLDHLLKKFDGNEKLALASYNAGPAAVKKYNGVPPYKETQNYVKSVLELRNTIKQHPDKQNIDKTETGE